MLTLRHFTVVPRLPPALERLRDIAHNLWWSWAPVGHDLFIRLDPDLWEAVHGNPIELLARVDQERLDELAVGRRVHEPSRGGLADVPALHAARGLVLAHVPGGGRARASRYFSMEYGIHECLPIYSGGLGVLAGDHLKSASDLGLPLVGVGLAYAEGYFRQALNTDGWQGERYPINDWHRMPVSPGGRRRGQAPRHRRASTRTGRRARAAVEGAGRARAALLLDANLEKNAPEDRSITGPLYGGDQEFRVRQEIMLGIGGVHALEALGLSPTVCHMNEGHSAFLAIERIGRVMRDRGVSFQVAAEAGSAGNVFTTHTPVPAGNDAFPPELVRRYLEPYRAALGPHGGRAPGARPRRRADKSAPFSMPVLAIRTADHYNGVSELHGEVSRKMWSGLWPELPTHEVPIESITNGVHTASWVARRWARSSRATSARGGPSSATTRSSGRARARSPTPSCGRSTSTAGTASSSMPARWLRAAAERRGAGREELELADEVLDPHALTIGFARRFATYKRATLLFRTSSASRSSWPTRSAPCSSSSPARRTRRTGAARS